MPRTLRALWPLAAVLAALAILDPWMPRLVAPYPLKILLDIGINIVLAVSLNLVNGTTGQFSMGHAGFMAVGGYVSAFTTVTAGRALFGGAITPPEAAALFGASLVLGGLAAAVAGFLVGQPSLRLKGDYLAIVTLGFGEIIRVIIENTPAVGGASGYANIPLYTGFFWVYAWVAIVIAVTRRLLGSTHGRALLAVREDEIAAEAVGVNTTKYKVRAFVISSFFAGVAGGLLGHLITILAPKTFTFLKSFEVIIMVVLGGLGSTSGSVLAAIVLTILPEALRPVQQWTGLDFRMVFYSLALIVLMILRPSGLFGSREIWELRKKKPIPTVAE